MIKLLILVLLYLILFEIYTRLKVFFKETFMLKYCLNRHKTQEMCDEGADAFLPILKFVPDWFATNKILEKLDNFVFFN